MARIAVIGAGFIGRAWSIVFLRGDHAVALWDPDPTAAPAARDFIAARLPELQAAGLLGAAAPEALLDRLTLAPTLEAALADAVHVQENGPERLADKQALFARLDAASPPAAVLASSTSTIPASQFTEALLGRARCLVAHPVNPPYLVPVVELCPAPWTEPAVVERTRTVMADMGMVPATVRREIPGFLLNRLQAALLGEAFRLVADGLATPEDIDATVKHGLGLRWAFMGPFETIDLNAPGGLADYCDRYGAALLALQQEMTPRAWTPELVAALEADRRAALPAAGHAARQAWRDRRLMALLAHKAGQEG
jgi:3-hydroxyacyl-CoA dehydrogenase